MPGLFWLTHSLAPIPVMVGGWLGSDLVSYRALLAWVSTCNVSTTLIRLSLPGRYRGIPAAPDADI